MRISGRSIAPIVQLQLPEQVAERLRALILECRLAPGARLVERDLADLLGVSRTPVREALFQLRREGLVSASESRGLFVSGLSDGEIVEIYQALAALERAALRQLPAVADTMLSALAAARQRLLAAHGDPERAIAADAQWHEALMHQSGNAKLAEIAGPLRALSGRYERAFFSNWANLGRSIGEHEAIEALLRKGDRAGAGDAIEAHWLDNIVPMRAAVAAASAN